MSRLTSSAARKFPIELVVLILLMGSGLALAFAPSSIGQTLPGPVYELGGRVLDQAQKPLSGASVFLTAAGATTSSNASTDASGQYKFSQIAAGNYTVAATHACCLRASTPVSVGGLELQKEAPDLILSPRAKPEGDHPVRLHGTAHDLGSGKPLAGVNLEIDSKYGDGDSPCPPDADCVSYGSNYQHFSAFTAADGSYDLEVNRGEISVYASLAGYDNARTYRSVAADFELDVPMRASESATVRLHGVVQSSGGSSLGGAQLSVGPSYRGCAGDPCAMPVAAPQQDGWSYDSGANQYNSTTTKSDGSWEMRVTSGRKLLSAYATEHLSSQVELDLKGGEDRQVDLVLEQIPPDSVRVHGRVTDARTGEPVAGAYVWLENQRWGHYNSTNAGKDGSFELWTKPGYSLVAASGGGNVVCALAVRAESGDDTASGAMMPRPCAPEEPLKEYFTRILTFSRAAGGDAPIEFKLVARPEPQSEFKGYVLNASSHTGVPKATITFYNELTHDWGTATTDANGSYRIKVHAGYYTVRSWAEHFFDAAVNAEIGDGDVQRLDLAAEPGEKQSGYGVAYGRASMVEDRAVGAPGAPSNSSPAGPGRPSEGTEVYLGEGGGLGPFQPAGGGRSPGAPAVAVVAALGMVGALMRRGSRRDVG